MYKKAYIEITNNCNLNCEFCHKPARAKRFMPVNEFYDIAKQVKNFTDYIYLHVFGEPLLHPCLDEILLAAANLKLKVNITTNGTLIGKKGQSLIDAPVRKVSFSLHSYEGNADIPLTLNDYLDGIVDFCNDSSDIIIELRLWNGNGNNRLNDRITAYLAERLGIDAAQFGKAAGKLKGNIYSGYNNVFNWASDNLALGMKNDSDNFCLGLRDQFAILCDGTVVPCCIDTEGDCALGNVLFEPLDAILNSKKANMIREGFIKGRSLTPLCLACDFRKKRT